ncbi:MAG TPA: thioredoxin family protein [Spirochaetota bacterium]|nr:thioredoxin family protein [Spirochaetota bacterium]
MKTWVFALPILLVCSACGSVTQGSVQTSETRNTATSDSMRNLFGTQLKTSSGSSASSSLLAGKVVGIYFSAHWCGPCRQFTPVLIDTYKRLKSQGKPFEIVFVSSDNSEADMYNYMNETGMPWYAVPWKGSIANNLKSKYGVRGIPTLIVVDQNGKTVSTSARSEVASMRDQVWSRWVR